ncbi:hypothetical protein DICPUDRAFT_160487 [Dictyostelium purpureum]|uniref:Pseudouridine synthase RsuA/RluA-like domain-containing protein n=1 Tax=Dictyostelium purpureum TaxID=5786 RepID=F1A6E1_DICPU|nr:uncharacterized protein DICPUDRAFT_160487 [Dictyostelium purpureum]EGC28238.1 hypothetical protein DICPUDRAFT_160487 [Dictyostelium purpureum]|eukprot:XP_003295235.1 hypothetical protein DICPUDRAFT_160487 [Dictyostelium purpureum]
MENIENNEINKDNNIENNIDDKDENSNSDNLNNNTENNNTENDSDNLNNNNNNNNKRKLSTLYTDDKENPIKKVYLRYHQDKSNLVTVEDPNNVEDSFTINKKFIQEDGSILSKSQYKKKIEDFNRKKKIENRKAKKQQKREDTHKKNEVDGNITKELLGETNFYYKDSLRHIEPYQFTFKVFAKERWFGQTVLDMFTTEFSTNSRDVYLRKIKRGLIKVNDKMVSPDFKIKLNDIILHSVHRHEPPVTGDKIKIVAMDDQVVVIDKPSSIPVHPCGRFRHNCVLFILAAEHGINELYGVHRLDRLTSGLLMLARTPDAAKKRASQIQSGDVSKQYFAKVVGKFPIGTDLPDGTVIVNQPIVIQNMRLGINHVGEGGKPSVTHFKLYSYDEKSNQSIVLCSPKTGRTHQIRVHLKWLGYPITNDPLYNNDFRDSFKALTSDGTSYLFDEENEDKENKENKENKNNGEIISNVTKEELEFIDDASVPIKCNDCSIVWSDNKKFSFGIYLHALSYESSNWSYKTDLPEWVKDVSN